MSLVYAVSVCIEGESRMQVIHWAKKNIKFVQGA